MSNKLNAKFLQTYIELDTSCELRFGVETGGVTEYITRLIDSRYAPDRDDVLPRLVKYRNIRNRLAHEDGALRNLNEITKSDIRWLENFKRDVVKKKDPISLHLHKTRRYARRRKFTKPLFFILSILAIAVAAVISYIFLLQ